MYILRASLSSELNVTPRDPALQSDVAGRVKRRMLGEPFRVDELNYSMARGIGTD